MEKLRVPLSKPKPDIVSFLRVMRGEHVPEKPPISEFIVDNAVMKPILENVLGRKWIDISGLSDYLGGQFNFAQYPREQINGWLDNLISFWHRMGYHFIRIEMSLPLPAVSFVARDTAKGNENHDRAWMGFNDGPIANREDMEKYPWPKITDETFYMHEYICKHLPEGMGFMACHAGGVYEHTSRLLGFTRLCRTFYDDPALVEEIAGRVGTLIQKYTENLLDLDGLSAVFQGEDLGFRTQSLLSPHLVKRYFLPWHKRYAQMAHEKGRAYFLHSCGKVDELMEDFIDYVKIDGKHSFEDISAPVIEAKKMYGDRIGILGGIDVDKLASFGPEELRAYVRRVIDACSAGGRFSVGSGNSIPSFVPVQNYLIMLDEALR
jgi:uroporphyrinogen decarboxylase